MTNIEGFLIEIDQIPWFANVGKPSELDGQALRITSWQAWPGPETPGSGLMQEAQVDRHERLLAAGDPLQIEALWQRIHDQVFKQTIHIAVDNQARPQNTSLTRPTTPSTTNSGHSMAVLSSVNALLGR